MCSSMSSISLCLPSKIPFSSHSRFKFTSPLSITRRNPRQLSLSSSLAEKNSTLELSWDIVSPDDYNGWAIAEPAPELVVKKGWRTFAIVAAGASVAAVLGLIAYLSFSSKGFGVRLRSPFCGLHGFSTPSLTIKDDLKIEEVCYDDVPLAESQILEEILGEVPDTFMVTEQKRERVIIPFSVDVAQQEAVSALKKLKIIEDDVRADELCTRREYARWIVRANSQLERSRKHRLNPFAALCGSRITAFNDVGVEDPDFEHIQTLAEAGIIRSKLSEGTPGSNLNRDKELMIFSPERFISRQDLVTWKAKIEYEVLPVISKEFRLQGGALVFLM